MLKNGEQMGHYCEEKLAKTKGELPLTLNHRKEKIIRRRIKQSRKKRQKLSSRMRHMSIELSKIKCRGKTRRKCVIIGCLWASLDTGCQCVWVQMTIWLSQRLLPLAGEKKRVKKKKDFQKSGIIWPDLWCELLFYFLNGVYTNTMCWWLNKHVALERKSKHGNKKTPKKQATDQSFICRAFHKFMMVVVTHPRLDAC